MDYFIRILRRISLKEDQYNPADRRILYLFGKSELYFKNIYFHFAISLFMAVFD